VNIWLCQGVDASCVWGRHEVVRTLDGVDTTTAAALAGVAGVLIGALAIAAVRFSEREQVTVALAPPALPAGVADVLAVLGSIGIVLDPSDLVVNNSPSAVSYGLVRRGELVHADLRELARRVRRDGVIRETELDLPRGPMGRGQVFMRARVAPLGSVHVLLLLEDETRARRVEQVRRDFVANVSHELKTPVGGLALLAEAVLEARNDPEAVERFAGRMQVEATRLSRLVKEIVDLSRLQVADTLHEPELVDIRVAVHEAIDHSRVSADAKGVAIVESSAPDLKVFGDEDLLVTAVRNLVGNAVAHSDPGDRVAVGSRQVGDVVEISVSDEGEGIPKAAQTRIFERFYRVDSARSRATGGTGLGLAIVKHICTNHGGDVTVWSEEGRGSTFTMRVPAAVDHATGTAGDGLPSKPTAGAEDAAPPPTTLVPNGERAG
jgi:two-component system, OmpR family, sensor histidine kinase SenX3